MNLELLTPYSAIIIALIATIIQILKVKIIKKHQKFLPKLRSLTAGIGLTYLFLHLLPRFIERANESQLIFLTIIIGFTIFYLIEDRIYRNTPTKQIPRKKALEDRVISIIYSITIGILLTEVAIIAPEETLFLAIPILLHTAFTGPTKYKIKNTLVNTLTKTSMLIGVIIGYLTLAFLPDRILVIIMGIAAGALLFLVTRHLIPNKHETEPKYFITGTVTYAIIILILLTIEMTI